MKKAALAVNGIEINVILILFVILIEEFNQKPKGIKSVN